jgi:nitrogen fixation protein FixH
MNLRLPGTTARTGERRLTGRSVFVMLIAFFGLVMIVNVVMIDAAISTFGGVDTPSSYQAGLNFKKEEAEANAQRALGWEVDGHFSPAGSGLSTLTVKIVDKTGEPVSDVDVAARLEHPVDVRRDVVFAMNPMGHGTYAAAAQVAAGQWRLDIDVTRDGVRMFRSRNHVMVQ